MTPHGERMSAKREGCTIGDGDGGAGKCGEILGVAMLDLEFSGWTIGFWSSRCDRFVGGILRKKKS